MLKLPFPSPDQRNKKLETEKKAKPTTTTQNKSKLKSIDAERTASFYAYAQSLNFIVCRAKFPKFPQ